VHYDEMCGLVQKQAGLPDRRSAEEALQATLQTLAERMPDAAAEHFAAQLPAEAAEAMERGTTGEDDAEARTHGEKFGLPTFVGRLAWRARTDEETAVTRAVAVFEVLDAAVAPELMEKLTTVLPHDVEELLPTARTTEREGA
jgi:uncharacterized protein (DUF2267 family)